MEKAIIKFDLRDLKDLEEIIDDAINYWEEELKNQESRARIQRGQTREVTMKDIENTKSRIERYYHLIWEVQDWIKAIRRLLRKEGEND